MAVPERLRRTTTSISAAADRGSAGFMLTAVCLIVLGVFSRLLPHPENFVAMGAIALYAGAKLPRRWGVVIPLAVMALSDLWLDQRPGSLGHSNRGRQYSPGH